MLECRRVDRRVGRPVDSHGLDAVEDGGVVLERSSLKPGHVFYGSLSRGRKAERGKGGQAPKQRQGNPKLTINHVRLAKRSLECADRAQRQRRLGDAKLNALAKRLGQKKGPAGAGPFGLV